jgi:hypothetical protein
MPSDGDGPHPHLQSVSPGHGDVGDVDALPMWAGQGVGLVADVQPAGETIRGARPRDLGGRRADLGTNPQADPEGGGGRQGRHCGEEGKQRQQHESNGRERVRDQPIA